VGHTCDKAITQLPPVLEEWTFDLSKSAAIRPRLWQPNSAAGLFPGLPMISNDLDAAVAD